MFMLAFETLGWWSVTDIALVQMMRFNWFKIGLHYNGSVSRLITIIIHFTEVTEKVSLDRNTGYCSIYRIHDFLYCSLLFLLFTVYTITVTVTECLAVQPGLAPRNWGRGPDMYETHLKHRFPYQLSIYLTRPLIINIVW